MIDYNDTSSSTDIVFTLAGAHSPTDNEELRIALRSIDEYGEGVGKIWIITDNPPKWLTGVNIINVPDTVTNNKDANLINKLRKACSTPEVSDRFIYWSDDQAITSRIAMRDIFPVYNCRGFDYFKGGGGKWKCRMEHTLKVVEDAGGNTSVNWDSHVPQPIDKCLFESIMSKADYTTLPGLCINTAYFGLKGENPRFNQRDYKRTYEDDKSKIFDLDLLFVGYNDAGYKSGLREALLYKFPDKSRYEK